MDFSITHYENQLGSKQDFSISGRIDDFAYLIVCDGHGKGILANKCKIMPWNNIINKTTGKAILTEINRWILINCPNLYRDGATISIAKIYKDKIKLYWLGDSQIHVRVNNLYYKSENHNTNNVVEVAKNKTTENIYWAFKVLNDTDLLAVQYKYFKFINSNEEEELLAMSRALGHENITLQKFQEKELRYNPSDSLEILIASDGLYDVLYEENPLIIYKNNNAKFFVDLATRRWHQEWNYKIPNNIRQSNGDPYPDQKQYFQNEEKDDIIVVHYTNNKPITSTLPNSLVIESFNN